MTKTDLLKDVKERLRLGQKLYLNRHIIGRFGPVLDVKPLGFGTNLVMVKLHNGPGGWVTTDPLMTTIEVQY